MKKAKLECLDVTKVLKKDLKYISIYVKMSSIRNTINIILILKLKL